MFFIQLSPLTVELSQYYIFEDLAYFFKHYKTIVTIYYTKINVEETETNRLESVQKQERRSFAVASNKYMSRKCVH